MTGEIAHEGGSMGIAGKVICAVGIIASTYIGFRVGQSLQTDKEYLITLQGNQASVTALTLKRTHRLVTYDNEAFMGSLDHCLVGVRQLAFYEGFSSAQPSKPAEAQVEQAPGSQSRLGQVRDDLSKKVDDLGAYIKDKYQQFTR